jgi:predicted RNA-binding protein associated with RNAse of E/G family
MSNLHHITYQIVSTPNLFADILNDSQILEEKFNLAQAEAQAILSVLRDRTTLERLLSAETLRTVSSKISEAVWPPPRSKQFAPTVT